MAKILSSLACNLDIHILQAALPLFEAEKVQAIEWSFDTLFRHEQIPDWFLELIHTYSQGRRLIGHGVYFSLFSGKWTAEQADWLQKLKALCKRFHFEHITEHFGFMTGEDFHKGAPLSVPFDAQTLAIGQDRLKRIQAACECPVGIENLAFAYSQEEVKKQGDFLAKLLEPVNGFLILDLHNLYCQLHNFEIDFEALIALFPIEKVREIHISGGSWEDSVLNASQKIRRDTHDHAVPETVFDLLQKTIPICPNLQYVVLEQMGTSLASAESQVLFQKDFLKIESIVNEANNLFLPKEIKPFFPPQTQQNLPLLPLTNDLLAEQQQALTFILENARNYAEAQSLLAQSPLAHSAWQSEKWSPAMLETAIHIAQKWKNGFE